MNRTGSGNGIFEIMLRDRELSTEGIIGLLLHGDLEGSGSPIPTMEMPSFELERVILDGFGPHDGPNELELSDGLTLVLGENGVGKTHILLAVNWCIFGDRGSMDPWAQNMDPFGSDLVNWAREGSDDGKMEIETVFRWKGIRYRVRRSFDNVERSSISWIEDEDGWKEMIGLPSDMDPDVLPFLLFQGEAVMFLSSEGYFTEKGRLETALEAISGASRYRHLLERLLSARELMTDRLESKMGAGLPLERDIEKIGAHIDALKERELQVRDDLEALEERKEGTLKEYRKALRELSRMGSMSKDQERSVMAKAQLPVLEERVQELLEGSAREVLRERTESGLKNVLTEKEEKDRKRFLFGAYEAQLSIVEKVLRSRRCICGGALGDTGVGRERLKELGSRFEARMREVSDWGADDPWTSDTVIDSARRCLEKDPFNGGDLKRALRNLKRAGERSQELADPGSRSTDPLIEAVREHERCCLRVERSREEMDSIRKDIELSEKSRTGIRVELVGIWGEDIDSRSYTRSLKMMDESINSLEAAIDHRMSELIMELENELCEIIARSGREDWISEFKVNRDNFSILVQRKDQGRERNVTLPFLSAGERVAVATLIVISMSRLTGSSLVMDSPFPYMDRVFRRNILEMLPGLAGRVLITIPTGTFDDVELGSIFDKWSASGRDVKTYELARGKNGSTMREKEVVL